LGGEWKVIVEGLRSSITLRTLLLKHGHLAQVTLAARQTAGIIQSGLPPALEVPLLK
jgi:hypothetical protein